MSRHSGFTLIELLITMTVGTLIVGSGLTMLAHSQRAERDIADRSDATTRGRVAIEALGRPLRSMTCLPDGTRPIIAASDDAVSFYADLDNDVTYDPEKWRLSAIRSKSGALVGVRQERWVGIATPVADTTAATSTTTVISGISARAGTGGTVLPLFSYAAYASGTSTTPTALPAGTVSAADLPRIAQIDIGFNAKPLANRAAFSTDVSSNEETSVYARTFKRDNSTPIYNCTG